MHKAGDAPQVGRRTIPDGWLSANRNALLGILCSWWPHVGWQLTTAKTREMLRQALQPLRDQPSRQYIDRLLRPTAVPAAPEKILAREIRKRRLGFGRAVKQMHDAQEKQTKQANECRELEWAVSQARSDQIELVRREFTNRSAELREAEDQLTLATAAEKQLEGELFDHEAAFALDQVLEFISEKRKYALNPLNLANAIAGLPFAVNVPFLGVWQSHARCSKLEVPSPPSYRYQVFEKIESIWERSQRSPIPRLEFFQQEIKVLPQTVLQEHPTLGSQRVDNYVRTHLCENWWYLQRAIEKSLQTTDDPRPMHFIIASNFDNLLGEPKTFADSAVAKTQRICD